MSKAESDLEEDFAYVKNYIQQHFYHVAARDAALSGIGEPPWVTRFAATLKAGSDETAAQKAK